MRAIASGFLAAVLAILCLADIWVWHRGYTLGDTVVYRWISAPNALRFVQIWTARGGLRILVGAETYPPQSLQLFGWEPGPHHGSYGGPAYPIETWGSGQEWGGCGFYYFHLSAPYPPTSNEPHLTRTYRAITFPHALLALLLLLYPLRFAWNFRHNRQPHLRRQRGLCVHCGYDLRGISHRCPECGTTITR